MRLLYRALILISALLSSFAALSATWNITYPRPLTEYDQRSNYPLQLLTLALEQTGVKYQLLPSDRIMLQGKALKQLRENRGINVAWSMTDTTREEELLPIRIPIFKGLIGWRIFLVKDSVLPQFYGISQFEQLQRFKAIQGHDWPDTKILQSNGFDVATSKEYDALFSMLAQSRGDFYPRSVVEIWTELESDKLDDDISVEGALGVRYPTAMYFFVNKRNVTLSKLIEKGLEKAIKNGEFDRLFNQYHADVLNNSDMVNRTFFQLANPLLPEKTPLARRELWYEQE